MYNYRLYYKLIQSFLSLDDLKNQLTDYIAYYNHHRLHASLGYIIPWDMIQGNQKKIFTEMKEKLKRSRENRIKQ